ncbi:MAG: hypothetical protein JJV99_02175 [Colwellia sp.]|nr:hypothetical protein [Colwellia sp.]
MTNQEEQKLVLHDVDICSELSKSVDDNIGYSIMLTQAILATGKTIENLTIAEFLKIRSKCSDRYNKMYS